MKEYILISVNERNIFNPDYFETITEAQTEMEKRVNQIVKSSGEDVDFNIDFGEAFVTDAHFQKGNGNWDFVICEIKRNKDSMNREKVLKAAQVLIDNGVKKDEVYTILQAIGYVLCDIEIDDYLKENDLIG